MNISRWIWRSAVATTLIMAVSLTSDVVAGNGAEGSAATDLGVDEVSFDVGGSCAALAYMNAPQLRAFINAGYADDFHSFCYPEEPSECSDYTPFMKGLGRLSTGDDGFHCSLQLQL